MTHFGTFDMGKMELFTKSEFEKAKEKTNRPKADRFNRPQDINSRGEIEDRFDTNNRGIKRQRVGMEEERKYLELKNTSELSIKNEELVLFTQTQTENKQIVIFNELLENVKDQEFKTLIIQESPKTIKEVTEASMKVFQILQELHSVNTELQLKNNSLTNLQIEAAKSVDSEKIELIKNIETIKKDIIIKESEIKDLQIKMEKLIVENKAGRELQERIENQLERDGKSLHEKTMEIQEVASNVNSIYIRLEELVERLNITNNPIEMSVKDIYTLRNNILQDVTFIEDLCNQSIAEYRDNKPSLGLTEMLPDNHELNYKSIKQIYEISVEKDALLNDKILNSEILNRTVNILQTEKVELETKLKKYSSDSDTDRLMKLELNNKLLINDSNIKDLKVSLESLKKAEDTYKVTIQKLKDNSSDLHITINSQKIEIDNYKHKNVEMEKLRNDSTENKIKEARLVLLKEKEDLEVLIKQLKLDQENKATTFIQEREQMRLEHNKAMDQKDSLLVKLRSEYETSMKEKAINYDKSLEETRELFNKTILTTEKNQLNLSAKDLELEKKRYNKLDDEIKTLKLNLQKSEITSAKLENELKSLTDITNTKNNSAMELRKLEIDNQKQTLNAEIIILKKDLQDKNEIASKNIKLESELKESTILKESLEKKLKSYIEKDQKYEALDALIAQASDKGFLKKGSTVKDALEVLEKIDTIERTGRLENDLGVFEEIDLNDTEMKESNATGKKIIFRKKEPLEVGMDKLSKIGGQLKNIYDPHIQRATANLVKISEFLKQPDVRKILVLAAGATGGLITVGGAAGIITTIVATTVSNAGDIVKDKSIKTKESEEPPNKKRKLDGI